ncbi:hypothetical protein [Nitratireductor thuwali]|uniref:Uncharacterized protein n=1 Tax=Nitratireductor thuwali TaxID=2267699 RepID=A0ABY5MH85_9HYPH|nr:hypothetical protein NTH_00836 [Nitratireductor thuwali]
MSEAGQKVVPAENVRRLSSVIRDMKNAAADREDVVVEMREASHTRLELLAQELQPVFADVPKDDPRFDLVISNGEQPRLWIDAVAHVVMGRDRRTYRFLCDTRLGRQVLAESADMKPVADQITRYIAERMVERQRRIEGDIEVLPRGQADEEQKPDNAARRSGWKGFFQGLLLVVLGGAVGAGTVFAFLSERFQEFNPF